MRELFTAGYNEKTDEIYGCEPDTVIWYHEDRHKQQYNNPRICALSHNLGIISLSGEAILIAALLYRFCFNLPEQTVSLLLIGAWFIAPQFILGQILEIDAWIYAYKLKRRVDGRRH